MREATLLLAAILVGSAAAVPSTTEPSWAPTGRLSQFKGFITPRPELPDDGRLMYASIWASWSVWSFCSNGIRMRVRACNTVRGFSCLGPNQETRPCDAILSPPGHQKKVSTDYDVVDEFEDDRREAMKQLYPDDPVAPPADSNFLQLSPLRPTALRRAPLPQPSRSGLVDHSLIGFEERRPANGADGSPGSDPEKIFGAKQFAVKSVTPDEMKELAQKELDVDANRLVPMGSINSEDRQAPEKSLEDEKTFEDITFDLTTMESTSTTSTTTPTPVTTPITAPSFSTSSSTFRVGLRQKFRSFGITPLKLASPFHNRGTAKYRNQLTGSSRKGTVISNVFNRSRDMRIKMSKRSVFPLKKIRRLKKRASRILHQLANVRLKKTPIIQWEAAVHPMKMDGGQVSNDFMSLEIQFKPADKEVWTEKKQKKKSLHEGGIDRQLGEGKHSDEQTIIERLKDRATGYRLSSEAKAPAEFTKSAKILRRTANHLTEMLSSNQHKSLGQKENKDDKIGDDLEEELAKAFAVDKEDRMEEELEKTFAMDKEEEIEEKMRAEGKVEERKEEKVEKLEEKRSEVKEIVDKTFEKAEVFGDSAVRVTPKLPAAAVDDNLEDLLEVADPLEEHMASLPVRLTTEEPFVEHEAVQFRERQPTIFAVTETDRINSLMAQAEKFRKQMKIGSSPKGTHKKKKYGITGFAFKKVPEDRPIQKLHDGEVGRPLFAANIARVVEETLPPETTTVSVTTTAVPSTSLPADDMPEISMDTLNALDWMLKNMTQAASKEDTSFLHQFTEVALGPKETEIKPSFPIQPTEPMETRPLPMKPRRRKLKKGKKKGKKAEITKLHDGEWVPKNLDKSKMFPKFKSRPMKIMKTRALGVRTINSDKDRIEPPTKETLMGSMNNPDQIFEEVKQLQAEMNQIEKQLETLGSRERQEILETEQDTMGAPLFVDGSRFDLFAPLSTEAALLLPVTTAEPPTLAPSPSLDNEYGPWSSWGLCFCNKQLRTRSCLTAGCRGVSYETRICSGGECASRGDATTPQPRTSLFEYNGGPLRPRIRQP